MTDPGGSSNKASPVGPVPSAVEEEPKPFICEAPCTNTPVKYLECLDGCAQGLHLKSVPSNDAECLYLQSCLFQAMSDAIRAQDDLPLQRAATTTALDPCNFCEAPIVPSPTSPVSFMENCSHYFHQECHPTGSPDVFCRKCTAVSSRVLLWPELFASETAKNEMFQLQKRSLGLNVSPRSLIRVDKCSVERQSPAFDVTIKFKSFNVCQAPPAPSSLATRSRAFAARTDSVQVTPPDKLKVCTPEERRAFLLRQYRCPLKRDCPDFRSLSTVQHCWFWHRWPAGETPRPKSQKKLLPLNDFPDFFCKSSSIGEKQHLRCSERILVHSQDLPRCMAAFHPSLNDLASVKAFAYKMSKQIMRPIVLAVPDSTSLACAFCLNRTGPEPQNSVRMHLQKCAHWMHIDCLQQARLASSATSNNKLELCCPICDVSSVRSMAWPGLFLSDMMKQNIFDLQLAKFRIKVKADTPLSILQVDNQATVFTLDYGGPRVVTIDAAKAKDGSTIHYGNF